MHSSQFGITFTDSRGPVNSDGPIHCIRSLNRMVRYSVMPLPGTLRGRFLSLTLESGRIIRGGLLSLTFRGGFQSLTSGSGRLSLSSGIGRTFRGGFLSLTLGSGLTFRGGLLSLTSGSGRTFRRGFLSLTEERATPSGQGSCLLP